MILRHRSFVGRVGTSKLIPALHVGPQLIGVSPVFAHGGRTCLLYAGYIASRREITVR
jgi:hypothetical protein